ncbi:ERCC4 domain-containing protein [Thermodesulfobacteriota bacterium]
MDITLIVDSREQLPYKLDTPSEVAGLPCGDYSIKGLEGRISIERKSLDDLIGCLTSGRARFERELHKGRALDHFSLVVEGTMKDILDHRYTSKMLPQSALQSLVAFSVRYRLPVWFCGNRRDAKLITESLLLKYARELEKAYHGIQKGP